MSVMSRRSLLSLIRLVSPGLLLCTAVSAESTPSGFGASVISARLAPQANVPAFVTIGANEAGKMWNLCNSSQLEWPYFESSGAVQRVIPIRYNQGLMPAGGGFADGASCAVTNRTPSSTSIDLYSERFASDTGERIACPDGRSQGGVNDMIAHELGHFLGHGESSCNGYIMSGASFLANGLPNGDPFYFGTRAISLEEKALADTMNETSAEEDHECHDECYGWPTPIVIDLDRNRFHFGGILDAVRFDIDGNGVPQWVSWTQPDQLDGFLVLDRDGNGTIDSGTEMFGDHTPLADGGTAEHGYQALAQYDRLALGGNGNGQIDPGDAIFDDLQVWIDADHDGISATDELSALAAWNLVAIGIQAHEWKRFDQHGNLLRLLGEAWQMGDQDRLERVLTVDVFLKSLRE